MKRVLFLTPLALAAITGCAPAPNQIQAGQWELVTELVSVDLPGMSADQQRDIREQIGRRQTDAPQCITDDQARTLVETMRRAPPNCRVSDEVYAGGVMKTHLTCPGQLPGQPGINMTLDGTFTRTTLNANMTIEGPNPTGGEGTVRRTQRIRGRRVGECPAAPPAPPMPAPPPAASAPPPATGNAANSAAPAGR